MKTALALFLCIFSLNALAGIDRHFTCRGITGSGLNKMDASATVTISGSYLHFSNVNGSAFVIRDINKDFPAELTAATQGPSEYSWTYSPGSGDTLQASSRLVADASLIENGQGSIHQVWNWVCFGELCTGMPTTGETTWTCKSIAD